MRYIITFLATALLLTACQGKKKTPAAETAAHKDKDMAGMDMSHMNMGHMDTAHSDTTYTCSMHPKVMQDRPGKCPICGMQLVPVKKTASMTDGSVQLSDQQVQLGGIRLDTMGSSSFGDQTVLTGTVTVDETWSTAVSARLSGRIEQLYIKTTGQAVYKGEKLYDLYSEELNTAEQEYLLALERQETLQSNVVDLKQLAEAAKSKLSLWGLSETQIAGLAQARKPQPVTSFYSPENGVVTSVEAHQGDYTNTGSVVLRLADLSTIWVEAQAYASQLSEVSMGAPVAVRLPEIPGREWTGRISFINPEVDPASRINEVRISLKNADGLLKPGMAAEVTVTVNRQQSALTLPETAVIRSARGNMVWVAAGHNLFRPVMVETGAETDDRVEIRSGLKPGDVVVTEGAYLVNSEYSFKHGGDAMAGMNMGNMKM